VKWAHKASKERSVPSDLPVPMEQMARKVFKARSVPPDLPVAMEP
jgi:hypothetical protein